MHNYRKHICSFLVNTLTTTLIAMHAMSLNAQEYTLVWEENFNGTTLDTNVWNYESSTGVWNWGDNRELQSYHKENVSVGADGEGGNALIITAKRESRVQGYQFTSGRINTKDKQSFLYGKIEARIKFPTLTNGLWPAFWMLGSQNSWPASGEIDIVEAGHKEGIAAAAQHRTFNGALHWQENGGYAGYGYQNTEAHGTSIYNYNTYTLVWTPQKILMYFNNNPTPYYAMNIDGADKEEFRNWQHYFILNMAVGGSFPGITQAKNITAPLPASMYVDYIRVYQLSGNSLQTVPPIELLQQHYSLSQGWNLISTHLMPANSEHGHYWHIDSIFPSQTIRIIKHADGFWHSQQQEALQSLQYIFPYTGYLVYATEPTHITINGTIAPPINHTYSKGWNIIGYPQCAENKLCQKIDIAEFVTHTPITYIKDFNDFWTPQSPQNSLQFLEPGKAYFLYK